MRPAPAGATIHRDAAPVPRVSAIDQAEVVCRHTDALFERQAIRSRELRQISDVANAPFRVLGSQALQNSAATPSLVGEPSGWLDLDWRWHCRGLELGCMFSINPDAHTIDELDLTTWGVLAARKGGIPPDRVLNCLSRDDVVQFLADRRATMLR